MEREGAGGAKGRANNLVCRGKNRGLGPRRGVASFLENLADFEQEVKGRALGALMVFETRKEGGDLANPAVQDRSPGKQI